MIDIHDRVQHLDGGIMQGFESNANAVLIFDRHPGITATRPWRQCEDGRVYYNALAWSVECPRLSLHVEFQISAEPLRGENV